jgi:hypothetical protein
VRVELAGGRDVSKIPLPPLASSPLSSPPQSYSTVASSPLSSPPQPYSTLASSPAPRAATTVSENRRGQLNSFSIFDCLFNSYRYFSVSGQSSQYTAVYSSIVYWRFSVPDQFKKGSLRVLNPGLVMCHSEQMSSCLIHGKLVSKLDRLAQHHITVKLQKLYT